MVDTNYLAGKSVQYFLSKAKSVGYLDAFYQIGMLDKVLELYQPFPWEKI